MNDWEVELQMASIHENISSIKEILIFFTYKFPWNAIDGFYTCWVIGEQM
jgi:hypothetical protein